MQRHTTRSAAVAVTSVALGLSALACLGAPANSGQSEDTARWDVRGNYLLEYDDVIEVTLNIDGVERRATASGEDQFVDLGTHRGEEVKLDLREYCAREEVTCPSEALWSQISIAQQDVERGLDVHVINVIDNTERDLPPGERAGVVSGLVDHRDRDRFLLGIESTNAQQGGCGALAISVAGGRFEHAGESVEQFSVHTDAQGVECDPASDSEDVHREETRAPRDPP